MMLVNLGNPHRDVNPGFEVCTSLIRVAQIYIDLSLALEQERAAWEHAIALCSG